MKLQDFKSITHFSGPTSITRLKSRKYSKDIYLIGEINDGIEGLCLNDTGTKPPFYLYLDKFFKINKKRKKYFDYLAEVEFEDLIRINIMEAELFPPSTIMYEAFRYFQRKGCFSLEKQSMKKCREEYPNVRFHITDLTINTSEYKLSFNETKNMLFFGHYILIMLIFPHLSPDIIPNFYNTLINKTFNYNMFIKGLEMYTSKTILKQKIKEMYESKIITSQLKGVDEKIKKKLEKVMKKEQNRIFKKINDEKLFFEYIKMTINILKKNVILVSDVNKIREVTDYVHEFVILLLTGFVDSYVLARLFKKFRDQDNPFMKYVFIHMGEIHVSFIKEVLQDVFKFKEIEHIGIRSDYNNPIELFTNKKIRCLEVKDLKLPFFK